MKNSPVYFFDYERDALKVFRASLKAGNEPDYRTVQTVLDACRRLEAGSPKRGQLYRLLNQVGINADNTVF